MSTEPDHPHGFAFAAYYVAELGDSCFLGEESPDFARRDLWTFQATNGRFGVWNEQDDELDTFTSRAEAQAFAERQAEKLDRSSASYGYGYTSRDWAELGHSDAADVEAWWGTYDDAPDTMTDEHLAAQLAAKR